MNEIELKSTTDTALATAKSMVVTNQDEFMTAGNYRKDLKLVQQNIKNYWAPKKEQAFALHKSLVQAEKDMLIPLEQADKLVDQRMGDYRREIERQRIEAERERQRKEYEARKAAEDAQRLIDEASKKEELDEADAEILMIAQEDVTTKIEAFEASVVPEAAKMDGISVRRTWKARVINPALVPISVAGIVIRPIDESALNKLAVTSKGGFECPGVEFYQVESTAVRAW